MSPILYLNLFMLFGMCPFVLSTDLRAYGYSFVSGNVYSVPYKCDIVSSGDYLLSNSSCLRRTTFVGRVAVLGTSDVLIANIHYYGKAGYQFYQVHYMGQMLFGGGDCDYLCSNGGVGWISVKDFTPDSITKAKAIPVGFNSTTGKPSFACQVHSFYCDQYPPMMGQVMDDECHFPANGYMTSTPFSFYHTKYVLAALPGP